MVVIKSFETRKNSDGDPFNVLILDGDMETVKSESGGVYFTSRKASVPSNFDDKKCESLLGRELPGKIVRVPCESYEFTTDDGELIILNHTYEYRPNEHENMEEAVFSKDEELV